MFTSLGSVGGSKEKKLTWMLQEGEDYIYTQTFNFHLILSLRNKSRR